MSDRRFTWKASGITPLVMNSNAVLITGSGKDEVRDKHAWELEHYRDACYVQADGRLYIPARAVKKAYALAAKFTPKKPKGTGFKSFGPLIEAALLVEGDALLSRALSDVQPWTAVVNLDPSKGPRGPRGPRTRPLVPLPWSAETTFMVMDEQLTEDLLTELAELSGKRCGLLDARAIDYGRCLITVREIR